MWNRWLVPVRCMRQVTQGWCTGMTLRGGMDGKWEGGSGWGTHVHPWLIHANVWQKPIQYCKVISFQLKKKKEWSMKNGEAKWPKAGEWLRGQWHLLGWNITHRCKKVFIYLALEGLSCSMWNQVPCPGITPRPPALEVWSLSHWQPGKFLMQQFL